MLEFYFANLYYSLKLLWHSILVSLGVLVPIFALTTIIAMILFHGNPDLFNLAVISALTIIVAVLLWVGASFLWRFLYISFYSIGKHNEDEIKSLEIFVSIYHVFTNWKWIVVFLVAMVSFFVFGARVYRSLVPAEYNFYLMAAYALAVLIKVTITVLVLALIGMLAAIPVLIIRKWLVIKRFLIGLFGFIVKVAVIGLAIVVIYFLSSIIYAEVSTLFDPKLSQLLNIAL